MKYILCLVIFGLLNVCKSQNDPEVGIVEKLGDTVPLDVLFCDEEGRERPLKDFIDKPTVLSLVYYRCPGICGPLLNGLKQVIEKVDLTPGKDFNVLTISFDHREDFELARDKRNNYLQKMHRPFPREAWRFLTGKQENILRLCDAVGFKFKKEAEDYRHAGTLIILSPQGKISRYLLGISFLPFDLQMAVVESSQGKVGPTIAKWLLYCYSYDPVGKRYGIAIIRISGVVIVFFILLFVFFLVFKGKKKVAPETKGT